MFCIYNEAVGAPTKIREFCSLLGVNQKTKASSPCVSSAKLDAVLLADKGDVPRTALTPDQKLCQAAHAC